LRKAAALGKQVGHAETLPNNQGSDALIESDRSSGRGPWPLNPCRFSTQAQNVAKSNILMRS